MDLKPLHLVQPLVVGFTIYNNPHLYHLKVGGATNSNNPCAEMVSGHA